MRRVRPDQVRSQHVAARTGRARQDPGLSIAPQNAPDLRMATNESTGPGDAE